MIIKTILVYILLIIATTKPVASCNENKVINSKKVANNKNYEITILYPHYLQIYSESEKFVKKYGVKKFLYEIYNILGTRKKACITNNNIALAEALGINIKPQELPANIDKSRIWEKISKSHNQVVFSHIADIFANTNRLKSISKTQKLFLEWNFRSTANYQYVLKKESGDIVVGWDTFVSIDGAKDYKIYTFGLRGCTLVYAISKTGACHASHFSGIPDQGQFLLIKNFIEKHKEVDIYVIGSNAAKKLIHNIKNLFPNQIVKMCDTKSSGLRSVVLKKNNHGISIYHCENRLDNPNDFIYSLNGPVHGMWFKYGDVARMYPGKNSEFISAKFSNL